MTEYQKLARYALLNMDGDAWKKANEMMKAFYDTKNRKG